MATINPAGACCILRPVRPIWPTPAGAAGVAGAWFIRTGVTPFVKTGGGGFTLGVRAFEA